MLKELYNIFPGKILNELRLSPTEMQLFMFSAITWNRHQIHFNRNRAAIEGFPAIAVQRGLIGNFLDQYLLQYFSSGFFLKKLQWKVLRSTFPGIELICKGIITSVIQNEILCSLSIENSAGLNIAEGNATLLIINDSIQGEIYNV